MHREMAGRVAAAVDFVEKKCCLSGLLEVWDYSRAITDLGSAKLTFTDVQMFLFKPNLNVILNLVGVHYCLFSLKVPVNHSSSLWPVYFTQWWIHDFNFKGGLTIFKVKLKFL